MRHSPHVKTYRQRVDWILKHRPLESGRSLSVSAGLSPSTVNNLLMRERQVGSASLDDKSCAAIAKAAGVDAAWLATGEGSPEPGYEQDPQPPPTRVTTREDGPLDTHEMLRIAVRDLMELDGLDEEEAWRLVRDVRLDSPSVRGYYRAAKLKLRAEAGSLIGERILLEDPEPKRAQNRPKGWRHQR